MRIIDRVQEILNGYPFEEVASAFKVDKAAKLEACSEAEIYRRVAKGTLGHIKSDGAERGRRGRAGGLRFTLEHIVRYRVEHEVLPGQGPRTFEEPARLPAIKRSVNTSVPNPAAIVHAADTRDDVTGKAPS